MGQLQRRSLWNNDLQDENILQSIAVFKTWF